MKCDRFSHIGIYGEKVFVPKRGYNSQDEAIINARVINLLPNQLTKVVPYRCYVCGKYHIGRNGKPITEKYRKNLLK